MKTKEERYYGSVNCGSPAMRTALRAMQDELEEIREKRKALRG